MNETRQLAEFVSETTFKELPPEVVEKTRDLILDSLGVQLISSTKPWSEIAYRYAKQMEGTSESTILYYGDKLPTPHAAFVNASFGHGFEMDDTHRPSGSHVSCIVVPTALALGEDKNIDGKDFLLANALGMEVMARVGTSIQPDAQARGVHSTSTAGTFGAAVAAGKILGLNPNVMVNAMSLAGSHSSGFMEYCLNGGANKRIHAGIAAQGGLRSALLALGGLTGPPTVLEGDWGFCNIFSASEQPNLAALTDDLGQDWQIMEVAFKRRPMSYEIQAMTDAVENILSKDTIKVPDIEQVIIRTNEVTCKMVGSMTEPAEVTASHFSAPFCLALRLVKGPPTGFADLAREFTDENVTDREVRAMAARVIMEPEAELTAIYPVKFACHVFIKLRNGATYESRVIDAKGTPENPMTKEELEGKFISLATTVLPADRMEKVIRMVRNLEKISDVSNLVQLLVK